MEDTIVICFLFHTRVILKYNILSTYHITKTIFGNYRSSTITISMIFEYVVEANILNNFFFYV